MIYASKQRGIALLTVLLILAVMVIIASNMSSRLQLELRRTSNIMTHQQALWYAYGAEALVEKGLKQALKDDDTINLDQYWATEGMMYPVENGFIGGQVFDMQACFNVNAVTGEDKDGQAPLKVRLFRNLLEQLDLDAYESEQLSDALRDWIDGDTNVVSSYGVEDAYYESLNYPYQAGNQRLINVSELRAIKGFNQAVYRKVRPYLCALPTADLKINVNTIVIDKPEILAGLFAGQLSLDVAKTILEERPNGGWKSTADFLALPLLAGIKTDAAEKAVFDIKSSYFVALLQAEFASATMKVESLFKAESKDSVYVIRRQFGGAQ
ncbi:type II secretion system minor pseudopilin GspK [Moritella viscosa]|uniref:Type II secretion system protein K n=1 Tax=Moritella viscosa TaxID=80854 RepID=A0ABY1HG62_9GAMM|nr:type II secretion system minor pseudopilin GspK [Moritella viscosa]SGY94940.1 General secretion pathway protein K [Moritella viscosa]SGZ06742.1 General secretion pathway protein K [Moritella viscosa]SHO26963.1 General secretion pathway protein K [Moritella viscosa]